MLGQATRVVLVEVEPRNDDAGHPSQAIEDGGRGEVSDDFLDIPQPTQGGLRHASSVRVARSRAKAARSAFVAAWTSFTWSPDEEECLATKSSVDRIAEWSAREAPGSVEASSSSSGRR